MRFPPLLLALLVAVAAPLGAAPQVATVWDADAGRLSRVAANRLIVGWEPAAKGALSPLAARPLMHTAAGGRVEVVTLAPGESLLARRAELAALPGVAWVSLDHLNVPFAVPTDPVFGDQWALDTILAPAAWDTETGGPGPIVAVLDSGFDLSHPDLVLATAPGANLDYGSTPNDPSPTWDTFNPTDPNCAGSTAPFHGTAVAGLVGATGNNAAGTAGTGWGLSVLPLKVMDDGCLIFDSYWIAALSALRNDPVLSALNVRVVNMSFGGTGTSPAQQAAVTAAWDAGFLLVAAAGNCGRPLLTPPDPDNNPCGVENPLIYPAALTNVMAVSSINQSETRSDFSEHGAWVDLAGPGGFSDSALMATCVLGTPVVWGPIATDIAGAAGYNAGGGGPGPLSEVCDPTGNLYYEFYGTSAASPYVAGVAALALSRFPDLTNDQLRDLLIDTVRVPLGWDAAWGAGIVDASAAVGDASFSALTTPLPALPPVSVSPLATTVPVWRGEIAVNEGTENLEIFSLTLTGSGSGEENDDITAVDLWLDNNQDGAPDGGKLATGAYTGDNGTVLLSMAAPLTIIQGSSATFLVTYDFADGPFFATAPPAGPPAWLALVFLGLLLPARRRRLVALLLVAGVVLACGGGGGSPAPSWGFAATLASKADIGSQSSGTGSSSVSLPEGPVAGPLVTVSK